MLVTRKSGDTASLRWTADALLRVIRNARQISYREIFTSESLKIARVEVSMGSYYLVMLGHTRMSPEDYPALDALTKEMGCYWVFRAIEMEAHFHSSEDFYGCDGYTMYVLHDQCPKGAEPVRSFCECKEFP